VVVGVRDAFCGVLVRNILPDCRVTFASAGLLYMEEFALRLISLRRTQSVFGINIKDLMQQAQGLQAKVTALQEELADKIVTGSAGGGMVRVEATGAQEIVSVQIEKELLSSDDQELMQELIVAAVNDALKKSKDLMTEEMSKLTGGLRIPGLT
jgi:nucleoid-associated protein EbfC